MYDQVYIYYMYQASRHMDDDSIVIKYLHSNGNFCQILQQLGLSFALKTARLPGDNPVYVASLSAQVLAQRRKLLPCPVVGFEFFGCRALRYFLGNFISRICFFRVFFFVFRLEQFPFVCFPVYLSVVSIDSKGMLSCRAQRHIRRFCWHLDK